MDFFFTTERETERRSAVRGQLGEVGWLWTDVRLYFKLLPDLRRALTLFLRCIIVARVLDIRKLASITRFLLSKAVIIWKIRIDLILNLIRKSGFDLLLRKHKYIFRRCLASSLAPMRFVLDEERFFNKASPLAFLVLFDLAELWYSSKHLRVTLFDGLAMILVVHGHHKEQVNDVVPGELAVLRAHQLVDHLLKGNALLLRVLGSVLFHGEKG